MPPDDRPGSAPDAATAELLQAAYRYALSLTAHPADAEDLVQEGWLRARERYGPGADRRLVFRAVRNLHIDGWRRARRHPSEALDAAVGIDVAQGHDDAAFDPSRSCGEGALGRHLAALRDVEREALLLSVVEGYSASEIAELTESTRGSVLSLLHRTKGKLQQALDADERDAEVRREHALRLVVPGSHRRPTR